MTKQEIAFIGNLVNHRYLKAALYLDLNKESKVFEHANIALEALLKDKYPLIILRDEVAAGDKSIIPSHLELDDYSGISCHIIQRLRKDSPNKDTPILVPYAVNDSLTPVQRYLKAGATACINMLRKDPIDNFIQEVRKYLR